VCGLCCSEARNKQLLQWLLTDSGLTVSEPALIQYASTPLQRDFATVLWLLDQGYKLPEDRYTGAYFELFRYASLRSFIASLYMKFWLCSVMAQEHR
jgi:hypothetical protein